MTAPGDAVAVHDLGGGRFDATVLRRESPPTGGFTVLGLDAAGASLLDAELPRRVALVLGNETDGLSPAVRDVCDGLLAIPMEGGVESLNVASAGAVAAFEMRRRRR